VFRPDRQTNEEEKNSKKPDSRRKTGKRCKSLYDAESEQKQTQKKLQKLGSFLRSNYTLPKPGGLNRRGELSRLPLLIGELLVMDRHRIAKVGTGLTVELVDRQSALQVEAAGAQHEQTQLKCVNPRHLHVVTLMISQ
jgi:hypothetical protein